MGTTPMTDLPLTALDESDLRGEQVHQALERMENAARRYAKAAKASGAAIHDPRLTDDQRAAKWRTEHMARHAFDGAVHAAESVIRAGLAGEPVVSRVEG